LYFFNLVNVPFLQEGHVHQVEEIQQPNPGDAGDKMDQAKDDQGGLRTPRELELGREE
jgi:hypothetical protein